MWQLSVSPIELIARTIIVYAVFLVGLRLFGKREVGQFTLFDLALILLAANALQPAMTGPDNSVTGGLVILVTIFVLNRAMALLRSRSAVARRLLEPQPTIVGRDGAWLPEMVEREGLDETDLSAALREHGLERVEDMKLAALEEDGSISIVPVDGSGDGRARRRRRYRRPR
ncbi:MAG TPA: YetF domain-containing protein [Candidatus Limnocylindrales bacterium]